uniref:C-type lectin domain-containing protein n=1 Tax=Acrobeloides nanus TaxID=290746 RepID=A0A914BVC8_9BILA
MVSQWEDTWREAVRACNVYNGNLTSIHDAFSDKLIYQYVAKNSTDRPGTFWIGGAKDTHAVPTTWTWIDGENWNYNNWAAGQPDNNPAYQYNYIYVDSIDGKWYSDEDYNTKFFVCEVPSM